MNFKESVVLFMERDIALIKYKHHLAKESTFIKKYTGVICNIYTTLLTLSISMLLLSTISIYLFIKTFSESNIPQILSFIVIIVSIVIIAMFFMFSLKLIKQLKRIERIKNYKRMIAKKHDKVFDNLNNQTEDLMTKVDNNFFKNIDVDSLEEDERFLLCNMLRRYSDSNYTQSETEKLKQKINNL